MYKYPVDLDSYVMIPNVVETAIIKAAKGKHSRPEVMIVLNNIEYYSQWIRNIIWSNSFVPSPYRYKHIIDNGKERDLTIPEFFPDQIIHHILIQSIEDWLMKIIDVYSSSSIPGRGRMFVVDNIMNFMASHQDDKYCIKCDIKKCYPSITAQVAFNALCTHFKGQKFLDHVWRVLSASTNELPLGNYMSAWLVNLVLLPMDMTIRHYHYYKREKLMTPCHFYIRYMDDFVFFGSNKDKIKAIGYSVEEELSKVNLQLKYKNFFNNYERPLDIVGYKFTNYIDEYGKHKVHLGLRKTTFIKFINMCKIITRGKYDERFARSFISSYGNVLHHNYEKLLYNHLHRYGVTIEDVKHVAYECDL